jgi:HNH endonuclease
MKTTESRFWSKVKKTESCWVWMAGTNGRYGLFKLNDKDEKAHRISYFLTRGPIPEGLSVDHLCFNKLCVNPEHLELVPVRINIQRSFARQTHCKRGHPLSGDNIRVFADKPRVCKKCESLRHHNYWLRRGWMVRRARLEEHADDQHMMGKDLHNAE